MTFKPHSNDELEVTTYFQLQRNRDSVSEVGEAKPGDVPKLPATSPWSAENMIPDEPLIDRSEDAATGGPNILEVDQ
jgi:hypothetical protein